MAFDDDEQLYHRNSDGSYYPVRDGEYVRADMAVKSYAALGNATAIADMTSALRRAWREALPEDRTELGRAILRWYGSHLDELKYVLAWRRRRRQGNTEGT